MDLEEEEDEPEDPAAVFHDPEIAASWALFRCLQNQWRRDSIGPYALDFAPFILAAQAMGGFDMSELLDDLSTIENVYLEHIAPQRAKALKPAGGK